MKSLSDELKCLVEDVKCELEKIHEERTGEKHNISSWSKKEILGHLIDSASNNYQRFVRAALNEADKFPTYDQNRWVAIQNYNEMKWDELIALYVQLNLHISRVLYNMQDDVADNPVNIGKESPVTLMFVATDYLRHMTHHLEKILEKKF